MSQQNGQPVRPNAWEVLAMPFSVAITVFALGLGLLLALGYEGNGEASPPTATEPAPDGAGAELFGDLNCGGCHTLSAAGTTGSVGPNLDETALSTEEIAAVIAQGRGAMPAFGERLDDEQLASLAAFVSG